MQDFKKSIKIGDYIKYIHSDTEGTVIDIKEDKVGVWVLIDTTNLYYKIEVVDIFKHDKKKKKYRKLEMFQSSGVETSSKSNNIINDIKEKKSLEEPIVSHITGGG